VASMRAGYPLPGGAIASVSSSIGIAFHEGTAEIAAADLLSAADRALYEAKTAGRDRYWVAA